MAQLRKQTEGNLVYYTSAQLDAYPGLRHAFFTKRGGVSKGDFASLNFRLNCADDPTHVRQNYTIAAALLGGTVDDVVRTSQKHTDTIRVVTAREPFTGQVADEAYDALITNVPGLCLSGFYADCQLSLLYDPKNHACGVVHSGWRGVLSQILPKTIEKMGREYGTRSQDLIVVVGPSICRRCFETDGDVPGALTRVYGDLMGEYIYREGDKWHVDLKNLTYTSLIRQGVHPYNIDISDLCPKCDLQRLFWSHRTCGEARGVHAGMIRLK